MGNLFGRRDDDDDYRRYDDDEYKPSAGRSYLDDDEDAGGIFGARARKAERSYDADAAQFNSNPVGPGSAGMDSLEDSTYTPVTRDPNASRYGKTRSAYTGTTISELPYGQNATLGLVMAIMGLFLPFFGVVFGIIALLMGNKAKKEDPENKLANFVKVFGIVDIVLWPLFMMVIIIIFLVANM